MSNLKSRALNVVRHMGLLLALWSSGAVGFASSDRTLGLPSVEVDFQQANRLVLEKDLSHAVDRYRSVLAQKETQSVNHNLGIAYFLDGDLGRSVLHLERALRQGFASTSTREILSLLRRSEGIAPPRYSLLQRLARTLPEEVWMVLVFGSFWVALLFGGYLYLLVKRQSVYRDIALLAVVVFAFGCVACVGLANDAEHGVLVGEAIGLKVVPTNDSDAFLPIKAGEMVRYLKQNNQFVFVETSGGVRGWVPESQFVRIRQSGSK